MARMHGAVRAETSEIVEFDGPYLSVDWEIEYDDPYVTNSRYIVVPFRNSVFLVPDHDIHRFCLAVRGVSSMPMMVLSSQFTRTGTTYQRPELPVPYQKYLDLDPIQAKIISVSEPVRKKLTDKLDQISQAVILDAGKDKHVYVGMRLEAMKPKLSDRIVTITEVRATDSTAESEVRRQTGKPVLAVKTRWLFHTATW